MWWLLARQVLRLRGRIVRQDEFTFDGVVIMPDLYFFREPQDEEKDKEVEKPPQSLAIPEEVIFYLFENSFFSRLLLQHQTSMKSNWTFKCHKLRIGPPLQIWISL